MAQVVKNLSATQETQIPFLGREDPLEKGTATQSRSLAWRILWTEEPGGLRSCVAESERLSDRHSHSPAEAHGHRPRGLRPLMGEPNWGQALTCSP